MQTRLTVTGTGIDSENRAGHSFKFTIYGDDTPSRGLDLTLRDAQVRGEYGSPQYRTYRGREIPVFKEVKGMALLNKVSGEDSWNAWINVAPRLVSDMLVLLQADRETFVFVHEMKEGRTRWIRSIGLQTTDPAEE